jgi:hypothetical protein
MQERATRVDAPLVLAQKYKHRKQSLIGPYAFWPQFPARRL